MPRSAPAHVWTLALTGAGILVLLPAVLVLSLSPSLARIANLVWLLGVIATFIMLVIAFAQFVSHKRR